MRASQIRFIHQMGFPGTPFSESFYSALMFQPRVVGGLVAVGILLQSAWLFAALSAMLVWSASLPSRNVFDALYKQLIARPRGRPPLPIAPAPRRFAQGMAGTVSLVIGVALFTGAARTAWLFEGMLAVAVIAVVFKDSCAGADVYYLLRRLTRPPVPRDPSAA